MTKQQSVRYERLRAARELQILEGRLPRNDGAYLAILRSACRAYDAWVTRELGKRRKKGERYQPPKKKAA